MSSEVSYKLIGNKNNIRVIHNFINQYIIGSYNKELDVENPLVDLFNEESKLRIGYPVTSITEAKLSDKGTYLELKCNNAENFERIGKELEDNFNVSVTPLAIFNYV